MSENPVVYFVFRANGAPCFLRNDVIGGWGADPMNLSNPPRAMILGPDGKIIAHVDESVDEVTAIVAGKMPIPPPPEVKG